MSKLLQKKTTTEDNNFHISQVASKLVSHTHDTRYYTEDEIDAKIPTYGYERVQIGLHPNATWDSGVILLNAVDEQFRACFYIHPGVDTSEDLVFSFIHVCTTADATVAFHKYVDAAAVGSEAITWNISNAVAVNLDSTVAGRFYKTDLTIPAASIASGDEITILYLLKEASRSFYFHNAFVRYTIA